MEVDMKRIFIILATISGIQCEVSGLISLDSLSFNKTIEAFPYSFIKFDTQSPSGQKHDVFVDLTKDLIEERSILLAEVQIPGYGHKDNHDLSVRFGLSQGILPEFIFFKRNKLQNQNSNFTISRYGGDSNIDNFKRFLQSKPIYISTVSKKLVHTTYTTLHMSVFTRIIINMPT